MLVCHVLIFRPDVVISISIHVSHLVCTLNVIGRAIKLNGVKTTVTRRKRIIVTKKNVYIYIHLLARTPSTTSIHFVKRVVEKIKLKIVDDPANAILIRDIVSVVGRHYLFYRSTVFFLFYVVRNPKTNGFFWKTFYFIFYSWEKSATTATVKPNRTSIARGNELNRCDDVVDGPISFESQLLFRFRPVTKERKCRSISFNAIR